jgi:dephospho-CoA kinase
MLSKMAKPIFKTDDLDKCKLPELKEIARQRGLRISGKKEDLKQRIQENISQHSKANIADIWRDNGFV